MNVGIFFGGQSREREISFAGGRTVYDNLNKELFTPVPIFIDSLGNFILLNWEYIYKGTIRDFYPPLDELPESPNAFQVYIESLEGMSAEKQYALIEKVGRKISIDELSQLMDFAFLCLHGPYGEDGNIQGILEWCSIPYSGSGILPSAIGINKVVQQSLMHHAGFNRPKQIILYKEEWYKNPSKSTLLDKYQNEIGFPFVVKAPSQGSSIGVTVVDNYDIDGFVNAVEKAFFLQKIEKSFWTALQLEDKIKFIRSLTDIREGIGMPVMCDGQKIYHPERLLAFVDNYFSENDLPLLLESIDNEEQIIIEQFINGREFSCIVITDEKGLPLALPPTEILKGNQMFDYRSKYLPGMTRKVTPIDLPVEWVESIRLECERLFKELSFNVYARLDGFITNEGVLYLNDPNTTSGMLPSSFFFHQAAEIGMNPSQFLTYIIRTSLVERIKTGKNTYTFKSLLAKLDTQIDHLKKAENNKINVAVLMGGFSSERHISVESGRNIFEKLASSEKYNPFPVFLTGNEYDHQLYQIPINIMLKDNADDIADKIFNYHVHPIIQDVRDESKCIIEKYVTTPIEAPFNISYEDLAAKADCVFIALHGRPGEDGAVQVELDRVGLPYNGSTSDSSQMTINKYETNKLLRAKGVPVANSMLVYKQEWENFYFDLIDKIEHTFTYPFIAKPADDGCSSAVKKINNREELTAYAKLVFGWEGLFQGESSKILKLKYNEEFPTKTFFMIEDIIRKDNANHFLEVTGGLLTKYNQRGELEYEMFEASETLASGEVLSLEEKFLAGEGQNITPARYALDANARAYISEQVKSQLLNVAKILNIQGYARIDAFVRVYDNNTAEVIVIEVNSLPGMTPATCIFHQTAINGYKPYDFIDNILSFGMDRRNNNVLQNN